jgi:hypothetical protein
VLDSGCTQHMTGESSMFNSITQMVVKSLILSHLVTMEKER